MRLIRLGNGGVAEEIERAAGGREGGAMLSLGVTPSAYTYPEPERVCLYSVGPP